MYSADCGLADSWICRLALKVFCGWNAFFFANTLHMQQLSKQDGHATVVCTSCVGANTKLVLYQMML